MVNLLTVYFYQLIYYLIIVNFGGESNEDKRTAFMYHET